MNGEMGSDSLYFLAKELKRNGYSFQLVVQPGSPLHQKASDAGLPALPMNIVNKSDALSIWLSPMREREREYPG